MVRFLVTIKVGAVTGIGGIQKTLGVVIRDTVTGKTGGTTYSGPEDLMKSMLELFESNPNWRVKYE